MKNFFVLILLIAFALAACDVLVLPTQAPVEPTSVPPTAQVIVVTVEVPVEVTVQVTAVPPTAAPTEVQPPSPTPTEAAPTGTASTGAASAETEPTETGPTETAPATSVPASGPLAVDEAFWGNAFKDITYSSPSFSLRCQPTQITFNATTKDPAITAVDFYYRIEDRKGSTISDWKNQGRMNVTGAGTFSITVSGETIHPDLRKALAWFDFQLVGLNKFGAAVGRTEKIVELVTYTIDCP